MAMLDVASVTVPSPAIELLQRAAAATGDGTPVDLQGASALLVEVLGTFVGVVAFEGTLDGIHWLGVGLVPIGPAGDGALTTTVTAAGHYRLRLWPGDAAALRQFRARVSAYASGTVTVQSRKVRTA